MNSPYQGSGNWSCEPNAYPKHFLCQLPLASTASTVTAATTTTTTSSSCVTTDTANAAIIVSGGYCHDSYDCKSVEVLDKDGSSLCTLPDFPDSDYRRKHSQSGLVACGGDTSPMSTSCSTFNSGSWSLTHTLNCERWLHSAWASPSGIVLMGGDKDSCNKASEIPANAGNSQDSFGLEYQTRYP